jgi:ABC-2 type transport system ATP-binding protein
MSTTPTAAIAIRNLTKIFPVPFRKEVVTAVQNLSLEVLPGQIYGLLGPNGSGKSTTMKVVLGLVSPTSGSTEIFGRSSLLVESREAVGFLPENPYFYKFLTGTETLHFFGRLCGLSGTPLAARSRELLALVGLESAANRRVGSYSKGMLQRIGLAQALIQEPRLLVLDEPTAGVDPAGSREIRDLLLELKKRGITVLLCSHLLGQVQEVCDRIGILHQGRLVSEGPLEQLVSVENQTELLLQNASPELLQSLENQIRAAGAQVLQVRKPQTTLERHFLEVTHGVSVDASSQPEK